MAAELGISSPLEWLRLVVALGVFLAPGLAIADRVFPQRVHLLTAPIWSFSILPLVAILLDFGLGVPINGWTTGLIAVAATAWAGWPRARQAWRWATRADLEPSPASGARRAKKRLGTATALVAIAGFLMLVHGLPHVPGDSEADASSGPSDAYRALAHRAVDAVQGDHYPYPVHVDEHIHIAWMAQIERQGTADIDDPYTGQKQTKDLFTVQGMRSERGFDVAIAQFHELTGLSFVAIARFLPAIWAGFLGITVWLTLRPAPGAMAAAALVAVLPSTARFLGVGFLIPSPFALPWFLLALLVAQRAHGAGRFFGLLLVVTAAHFMHLVFGVLSIAAALLGTFMRDERPGTRASMALAAVLPLVWILPVTLADARDALTGEHTLPFATGIFTEPTLAFYLLGVVGAALAFAFPGRHNQPHRALAGLAILMALSMALSIHFDHRNEGTYARQLFAFLISIGALASYGLADGVRRLWAVAGLRWRRDPLDGAAIGEADVEGRLIARALPAWPRHALVAVVVAVMLAAPLHHHLERPMYRVHDERSWQAAHVLEAHVGPDDVFLSHPWQAPLYNSLTGAIPHTVLRPGSPPERGADWAFYLQSGGADEEWLAERGITVVVSAIPPNAPHGVLGQDVYRLT